MMWWVDMVCWFVEWADTRCDGCIMEMADWMAGWMDG